VTVIIDLTGIRDGTGPTRLLDVVEVLLREPAPLRTVSSRTHAPITNRGEVRHRHRHSCSTNIAPCRGKEITDMSQPILTHRDLGHEMGSVTAT
jgi:hypothetical protein